MGSASVFRVVALSSLCVALSLSAAPVAGAQGCGDTVVLNELDAGVTGPRLRTPDGAPVVGGDFSFRVEGAEPNAMGAIVYSGLETPFFDPAYGATFWFGLPFETILFTTDANGDSPLLIEIADLDPAFCGSFGVFQAGVFDPAAMGGVAVTNAIRLLIGAPSAELFSRLASSSPGTIRGRAAAVDDFDGDGIADLITASGGISVRIGQAGGGFIATGGEPLSGDAEALGVADLDGNGDLDVAAAVFDTDMVVVAFGDGVGDFLSSISLPASHAPSDVAIGDFDGNGSLDLAVAGSLDNRATVHLGLGGGAFGLPRSVDFGFGTHGVAAVDLDQSGDVDLVATSELTDQVAVRLGNGDGTFDQAAFFAVGDGPRKLEVADLDGDSRLDVVVTDSAGVWILTGNGDGTLGTAVELASGSGPEEVVVADLDADTDLDVVVLNGDSNDVSVLLGDGAGTFTARHYLCTESPEAPAVIDGDDDGSLDLLVIGDGFTATALLLGDGHGSFAGSERFAAPPGDPVETILADLDGDGRGEVVTLVASGSLSVDSVDAPDGIGVSADYSVTATERVLSGDFNGDGALDLLTLGASVNAVGTLLINDGSGALGRAVDFPLGAPSILLVPWVGDLNGDLRDDLIAIGNDGFLVFRGQSGGTLLQVGSYTATGSSHALVADLTGDGQPEVVMRRAADDLFVFQNFGDGTFATPSDAYKHVPNQSRVFAGDADGDLFLDLFNVPFMSSSGSIQTFLNDGDGTFTPAPLFANTIGLVHAFEDVDGDGLADLLSKTRVQLGNGDGTFGPSLAFLTSTPATLHFADWNGDGDVDLLPVFPAADTVNVGVGNGNGTFTLVQPFYEIGVAASSATVGDQDGDGIPDLLVLDDLPDANRVTLLVNLLGE